MGPTRFYLETSERSMETHAVQMPEEAGEGIAQELLVTEVTVCGHTMDADWQAYAEDRAKKQPWPTCQKCYDGVVKRAWWPHNLDLPQPEEVASQESGPTDQEGE